jgi:hypothetical protein
MEGHDWRVTPVRGELKTDLSMLNSALGRDTEFRFDVMGKG